MNWCERSASADVVATILGIIIFFIFLHARTSKSEVDQGTGAKRRDTALKFGFLVGSGRQSACAMGEHPPRRTHINLSTTPRIFAFNLLHYTRLTYW